MTFPQAGRGAWQVTRGVSRGALWAGRPAAGWALRRAVGDRRLPVVGPLPEGRMVDLPDRGRTHVLDVPGPTPDAPVVLLMHGIGTTGMLTWFTTVGALAERCRVVLFDQRWHGRGIGSDHFVLDDCADDAAAVLDALGIDRALVVGYSMGGATAQVFWQRHQERVAGLMLCSTAARWTANAGERLFYPALRLANVGLRATASERVRRHVEGLPPPSSDLADLRAWCLAELRSTSPWALPLVLGELSRFDSRAWIGGVEVPSAVVVTARDRTIATARQHELAALLPTAFVREAPGGHASLALDHDRWLPIFLGALDTVLERIDPGERRAG